MNKFTCKYNSIMFRLMRPMLIVLLVQGILFVVIVFGGGTIERFTENSFAILNERVRGRKNYLQNEIKKIWSNVEEFENHIQKQVNLVNLQKNPEKASELLENISDNAVVILRQRLVTGAFVVLEGDGDDQRKGIYIRDLDPSFNPTNNSDILMERGSMDIAKKLDVSLDRRWSANFKLAKQDEQAEFYYKPFLAAKEYKGISSKDLGYWSRPFRLNEDDAEVITYSIPLIDEQGEPYGVVGIELTLDYLRLMLHYDELAPDKQGSYLLGIGNNENTIFENVLSSGHMFKKLVGSKTETVFNKGSRYHNIYKMEKSTRVDKTTYGCVQYLNLYNVNTPFENDKWALIGIVEEGTILKPIRQLKSSVLLSLLISLIMGIILIFIVSMIFIKPVTNLVKKLRESNPDNPIVLDKTNIGELDELAAAIEYLSKNVADSASKLSQIIGMVNIPIGAFEYTQGENRVFCTSTLFEILGIDERDGGSRHISVSFFQNIIESIKRYPEPDLEDIYRYEKSDGTVKWIRLKTQEKNRKILGVAEDVTKDTLAKRKIEYERDHDILTHLLNRRAFSVTVKKKMEQEEIDNAALVMWDLDNLKYVNDTYGHDYGDQYIKMAASRLNEFTVYNSVVARMSGDEFYTFIYGYKDKEEVKDIVKNMQDKLHNTLLTMPDGNVFRIRASAGIAWYPDDSDNYEELIKYSDFAMYEVKNTDKGSVGEFNKNRYDKDSFLLHGKEELNRFIDEELVDFAFQPIVDAKTGKIFAYEALMRPRMETIKSPFDILRLAQSQSKLYEIERITWFKAMEAFENNRKKFGDAKIFINSIPNHVLSDNDIIKFEKKYKEHLSHIVVEIIENEQSNEQCTKKKQDTVASWNSSLALDDFGSGYNSEIALLVLSPAFIKIDMTIIRGIDKDLNRQKLLQNLLSYAKSRQIKVIAEGIETKEEMETLILFDVDYMQGYYLGKPNMIPGKIPKKLTKKIRQTNNNK